MIQKVVLIFRLFDPYILIFLTLKLQLNDQKPLKLQASENRTLVKL